MKVLLLQDVPNVGQKYETHEVANGYGTNFLIPRGLAQVATPEVEMRYKTRKEKLESKRSAEREELVGDLDDLDGTTITFTRRANDQGHLFAGIGAEDIAEELSKEIDHQIKPDYVSMGHDLKEVGEEEVEIAVDDKVVTVTVSIKAE